MVEAEWLRVDTPSSSCSSTGRPSTASLEFAPRGIGGASWRGHRGPQPSSQMRSAMCILDRQRTAREGPMGAARPGPAAEEAQGGVGGAGDRDGVGLAARQALLTPRARALRTPGGEPTPPYDPLSRLASDHALPARCALEHMMAFKAIRSRPIAGGRGGVPTLQAMGWQLGPEPPAERFLGENSKSVSGGSSSSAILQVGRQVGSMTLDHNMKPVFNRVASRAPSSASSHQGAAHLP